MKLSIPQPCFQWKLAEPLPLSAHEALSAYPPLLQPLLYNRKIRDTASAEQYFHRAGSLYDPFLINGMDIAVNMIFEALDAGLPIAVYGDYDADGVTASTLLTKALMQFGDSESISHYIPDRFEEGYGLNSEALQSLYDEGIEFVITVDCGIRSVEEAAMARKLGMTLIISDHHEPGEVIPSADVVLCPKLPGNQYPEKNLAGVGIAYKIVEALYQKRPLKDSEAKDFLDLVAIGTVADVVPLTGENRSLVRGGLERLHQHPRPGILALAEIADFHPTQITAGAIGYIIGPRLNASGRLDKAEDSFQLLSAEDMETARACAAAVDQKNTERRNLTTVIQKAASDQVDPEKLPGVICVQVTEEINGTPVAGIVGLAASKIMDENYRPAVIGAKGKEFTRASCRSIDEFSMIRALDECSDLMEKYGGHQKAAGLTVSNENWPILEERLNRIAERRYEGKKLLPTKTADMELPNVSYANEFLMRFIESLEPCGEENRIPTFILREVRPNGWRKFGKERQHLRLSLIGSNGSEMEAVFWNHSEWIDVLEAYPDLRLDLLFFLERNDYNHTDTLRLKLIDIHPSASFLKAHPQP